MKILIRIGVALLALFVLGLGALALLLPRIVESDLVRSRIHGAMFEAVGREVTYAKLGVGLLPPSLRVEEPRLAGAQPGDDPLIRAERIELHIALLPLLARALVIKSLEIDGARVRLVRTADGIESPIGSAPKAGKPAVPESGQEPAEATGGAAQVSLAIQKFTFSDGALTLEDRTVKPAVVWDVREIEATLHGESLDQPVEIDASLTLASGGEVTADGTASLDGVLDLQIELAGLALAPLQPYVQSGAVLDGLLAGTLRVAGPAANPADVSADLAISGARFTLDDIAVNGSVTARADVHDVVSKLNGDFALDAGGAEIRYGDYYRKPPGKPATVTGRIVTDADGTLGTDDVKLVIPNFDAKLSARFGAPLRIDVQSAVADMKGAEAFVLPLAATPASGILRVEALRYVSDPASVTGNVHLDRITMALQNVAPITLNGDLIAQGTNLRSRDLTLAMAEQPLSVDLRMSDLFGALRYSADLSAKALDSNRLAEALSGRANAVEGPFDLQGTLAGTLAGDRSIVEDLDGQLQSGIIGGRLVGVSLLKLALDQLGALGKIGALAVDAGRIFGGRDLQKFYGDEFDSIQSNIRVVDGTLYAEPMKIVYPNYGADLSGKLSLVDLTVDMKGELTIFEKIDVEIAGELGAGVDYAPLKRSIPLAAVTGSIYAPKVTVAHESALRFVSGYSEAIYGGKLRGLVDKELGAGAGEAIQGALNGILGGKKKPAPEGPAE